MATLVLSTAGNLIAGPIGGAIGAFIGNTIDQAIFAPKSQGPRLDDLTVQSSAYGAPLPHLFGTVRATGNIIWSSGLKETKHRSGGGKRSAGRTTTYSYSASFAVALSARRIISIGRIWGDGKLLKSANGELTAEATLRVYRGDEEQTPDPLIVATEGLRNAPAYRGIAYAVFEDLELADFANRIPNLSFEVVADASDPSIGEIATALCTAAGFEAVLDGVGVTVKGFAAARNVPAASWIGSLSTIAPIGVREADGELLLTDQFKMTGMAMTPRSIVAARESRASESRPARLRVPGSITLGFLDPDRDYLAGLQRAFRSPGGAGETHTELPAAMAAADAKRIAQHLLNRSWTQSVTAKRRLSYRAASVQPGDRIELEDGRLWEVRRALFEAMTVELDLEPIARQSVTPVDADGGRGGGEPDLPQGETHFHAFELPPIGDELPLQPRIWIAAGGSGAGWRRADVWLSRDAGVNWSSIGIASDNVAMGAALNALPPADSTRWDNGPGIEVEMISETAWLESRAMLSVLAGANHALLGDEIVQFRSAEAIGPRRFRLSGLLRGRRGTDAEVGNHSVGERFVLLPDEGLFASDLPIESLQGDAAIRLVAPNMHFADAPILTYRISGRQFRPLSPVHVRAALQDEGDIGISWVRRSRTGFGWTDFADAPLAESRELYRVRVNAGAEQLEVECGEPGLLLTAGDQLARFGALPSAIDIEVAQWGELTGYGDIATRSVTLDR